MGYIRNKCPKCSSGNITPYDKRKVGKNSVCKYICEDCGEKIGDTVYYEEASNDKQTG